MKTFFNSRVSAYTSVKKRSPFITTEKYIKVIYFNIFFLLEYILTLKLIFLLYLMSKL